MAASELWVADQGAMPGWARGRMNATVIMPSQGLRASEGSFGIGLLQFEGVTSMLLAACALPVVGEPGVSIFRLSIDLNVNGRLDFDRRRWPDHPVKLTHIPAPHERTDLDPHRF